MSRSLRVLALVQKRLDLSPGQRYRIEQWAPRLRAHHGIEVDFAVFESPELTATIYQRGQLAKKGALILRDLWRRRTVVPRAKGYDAVFIYREAALLGPAFYERRIAAAGVPVILDFDDAIWQPQLSGGGPNGVFAKLRFPSKTSAICRLASAVTVGNEYLAAFARRYCSDVAVVPTTVDLSRYVVTPPPVDDPIIVVWTGSHSTLANLEQARGALERLGRRRHVRLRVICDRRPRDFANVETEFVPWRSETEAADVGASHIGIMPLPDDTFTRGKCGLKGLLYMASGRPAVMSPVGVNADIIDTWTNGVLATTEDEWVEALDRLAGDAELRARLGAAGRKRVEERYTAEHAAASLAAVIRRVVEPRRMN